MDPTQGQTCSGEGSGATSTESDTRPLKKPEHLVESCPEAFVLQQHIIDFAESMQEAQDHPDIFQERIERLEQTMKEYSPERSLTESLYFDDKWFKENVGEFEMNEAEYDMTPEFATSSDLQHAVGTGGDQGDGFGEYDMTPEFKCTTDANLGEADKLAEAAGGAADHGVPDRGASDRGAADRGAAAGGAPDRRAPDRRALDRRVADCGVADLGAADRETADGGTKERYKPSRIIFDGHDTTPTQGTAKQPLRSILHHGPPGNSSGHRKPLFPKHINTFGKEFELCHLLLDKEFQEAFPGFLYYVQMSLESGQKSDLQHIQYIIDYSYKKLRATRELEKKWARSNEPARPKRRVTFKKVLCDYQPSTAALPKAYDAHTVHKPAASLYSRSAAPPPAAPRSAAPRPAAPRSDAPRSVDPRVENRQQTTHDLSMKVDKMSLKQSPKK